MPKPILRLLPLALLLAASLSTIAPAAEPIRALLIAGGCCHDYTNQPTILTEGISARAKVTWTIVHEGDGTRDHMVSIYKNPDWAKGYDIVVHDECFGYVSNATYVEGITAAHSNGIPAVLLHCSTHSYRMSTTDEWRKLLGVSSYQHEKRRDFEVFNLKPENPVMKGFPAQWHDAQDELYEIKKQWPNCIPLAKGVSVDKTEYTVVWLNTYGKARVFATTLGHGNETVQDPVYLDLVTRGLLWACHKLDDSGKPITGYGK